MAIKIYINNGTMNAVYHVQDESEQRRVKSFLEAGRHPGITQCSAKNGTTYVNLSENVSYAVEVSDTDENDSRPIAVTDNNAAPEIRF